MTTATKLSKRLALALGISCFVNVGLLAFGLYEWQEGGYSFLVHCPYRPQRAKIELKAGADLPTLTQTLRELELLSYDELLSHLTDSQPICEGYRRQDIALSLLAERHFFDLQRALGSVSLQKRAFRYIGKDNVPAEIILFPMLPSEQYAKVSDFIRIERYPFTAQGLFEKLKVSKEQDLKETFECTREYACVDILLRRGTNLTKECVFELVQASDWKPIKDLYNQMRVKQNFTPETRRAFLVKTLPHSATILLQTDPHFALHSLSDTEVIALLSGNLKAELAKAYALGILESPRSDAVWKKAIAVVSTTSGLDPSQETRLSLLQRFGRKVASKVAAKPKQQASLPVSTPKQSSTKKPSTAVSVKSPPKPAQKREIAYTVKAGDTLWQIAKRHKVDVEKIKKRNNLKNDALKPGSVLFIPES